MRSYNENVRLRYRLLSKIYDLMDPILFNSKKGNPRCALAGMIPDEELEILDVCPGTGCTTVAIASANKRNRVTGIDLSVDMLRVAERKVKRIGLENEFSCF
jgi:ubiquinone/menaquinone biosynthesis C-methylase UbiE